MHVGDENSPANLRNTPKSMAISNFRSGSWLRENVVARGADKGGWNLLFSWWLAGDVINPAVHFGLSGAGPRAWFGWPDVPQLEKLITDWVRAGDETKRKQLASEVQKVALSELTYVPWGEWFQPTVFRKNVRDVLKFGAPIFWNVKVT